MKTSLLVLLLTTIISCDIATETTEVDNCNTALELAIQKNIKYRGFSIDCGWLENNNSSRIFLLPLNKEIIDAVIDLKCVSEGIDSIDKLSFKYQNYNTFLNSFKTAFILIVVNNSNKVVQFSDIPSSILLKFEDGQEFKLSSYTQSLGSKLNPGWNSGYLYFDTTVPSILNSYSVHFNNLNLYCDNTSGYSCDWAFAFDNTVINYLALIERGLNSEEIMKRYVIKSGNEIGITELDILNIVKLLIVTVSKFA